MPTILNDTVSTSGGLPLLRANTDAKSDYTPLHDQDQSAQKFPANFGDSMLLGNIGQLDDDNMPAGLRDSAGGIDSGNTEP